jgi:acyl dehydratase
MWKFEVGSDLVGVPWKEVEKEITWRHTTNYAAVLDDNSPFYFDDERPEGIVAHPMFVVCLGWPMIITIDEQLKLHYDRDAFHRIVHYTTWIEYEQQLKPGIKLKIRPTICNMTQQKTGVNCVFKFPAYDESNKLVYTEYMGCLLRDVGLIGGDKGSFPAAPRLTPLPAPVWETAVNISPVFSYLYDATAQIWNPIHTSPKFAHSVNLPDIVVQGTSTIAFGVREVIRRELLGDPTGIKIISARLTAMIFPYDRLRVQLLKREVKDGATHIYFEVLNKDDKPAVTAGYLKVV